MARQDSEVVKCLEHELLQAVVVSRLNICTAKPKSTTKRGDRLYQIAMVPCECCTFVRRTGLNMVYLGTRRDSRSGEQNNFESHVSQEMCPRPCCPTFLRSCKATNFHIIIILKFDEHRRPHRIYTARRSTLPKTAPPSSQMQRSVQVFFCHFILTPPLPPLAAWPPPTLRAASIACIAMSALILIRASSTSEAPLASPAARNSARADANSCAVVLKSLR